MKLTLLVVGKTDIRWVEEGTQMYISRLVHYIPFEMIVLPELKKAAALREEQIKTKEGEMILAKLRPSDYVILLDEHGREFRSVGFAADLAQKLSTLGRDMVFVIGGAYGFSSEVYSRADAKLSLSRMTFSHQMIRTIFVEQLYRAFTILRSEPYHHE